MRTRASFLLLAVVVATAGCGRFFRRGEVATPVHVAVRSESCAQFREYETGQPYEVDVAAPREQQIAGLGCFERHYTAPDPNGRAYVIWHRQFDDRSFDPVLASMIVLNCAAGDRCQYPYVLGQMEHYAREAPTQRVADALLGLSIDPPVRDAYLRRYDAARTQILTAVAALDGHPDAPIVRDVPRRVREQRARYHARFEQDFVAFEALMPALVRAIREQQADPVLLARAIEVRDAHVRACVAETDLSTFFCWNGTFARHLTWAIAWQAILADDPVLAYAEADTYLRGIDVTSAAAHVSMAQEAATDIGQRYSFEVWRHPRNEDRELAARIRTLHNRLDWAGEEVSRVAVRNAAETATIHYKTRVSGSTEYDCEDRIDLRQDDYGNIQAYRRCRAARSDTQRTVTRPVTVPAFDAEGLEPGQFALTVFDPRTREGRIVETRPTLYSEQADYDRIRFTPLKLPIDRRDQAAAATVMVSAR